MTFLRIPPFPGLRSAPLASASTHAHRSCDPAVIADLLRHNRVGGCFWGAPLELDAQHGADDARFVLVAGTPESDHQAIAAELDEIERPGPVIGLGYSCGGKIGRVAPANTDVWDVCAKASLVIADADSEVALVAALIGVPFKTVGRGRYACLAEPDGTLRTIQQVICQDLEYRSPFDGAVIGIEDAIAMLAEWRRLIMANREVAIVLGIARWKRVSLDPMLWDGTGPVRYSKYGQVQKSGGNARALAWVARTPRQMLERLEQQSVPVGEIEDGMIRSTGLGADCVPPLSIVVDRLGAHFDPSRPSELEELLNNAEIDEALCFRAAHLRETLVREGISKYAGRKQAAEPMQVGPEGRKRVLVAGQVEDDRSVVKGGQGLRNADVLERARASEPDAWIVYKPHPDVEAGHRVGHLPDTHVRRFADAIDRTTPIVDLLEAVDGVHVLTSLTGFEALLRNRQVTTHGVPFYAGWGLTRDFGQVPARRNRMRSLDELVAASLILYPRYVDPVTRLPCTPEVLVARIAAGQTRVRTPLTVFRSLSGRLKNGARRRL